MHTATQLISTYGVEIDPHLDREALVPVSAGIQRQGDIIVVPAHMVRNGVGGATTTVPRQGVPVVRGESGGNTHLLVADGDVAFDFVNDGTSTSTEDRSLVIGNLLVAEGATAFLAHPEHGYAGIAPGAYEIRRQREQADEIRIVAD